MLKIENLSSGYGKKQVLFDISLEVKPGEIVLLTGSNGSGKSTLLKCIYNILPLWHGAIYFDGQRIDFLNPSDLIRKGIVYIPQKDFCFENLTVDDNLKVAGNIYQKKELDSRIDQVYQQTELKIMKKRKPFNLSGGEKKLLAFAMGLLHQPKMILFDEPLSGMDEINSFHILSIFSEFFKKDSISAIIVEHKDAARDLYSRKVIMNLGTCD